MFNFRIAKKILGKKKTTSEKEKISFFFTKVSITENERNDFYHNAIKFLLEKENDKTTQYSDNQTESKDFLLYQSFLEYSKSLQAFALTAKDKNSELVHFDNWYLLANKEQQAAISEVKTLIDYGTCTLSQDSTKLIIPDAIIATLFPYQFWPYIGLPQLGSESIYLSHCGSPYLNGFELTYNIYSERRRQTKSVHDGLFFKTSNKHLLSPEVYIVAETIDQFQLEQSSDLTDHALTWARANNVLQHSPLAKDEVSIFSRAKLLVGYRITAEITDDKKIRPVIIRSSVNDDDFTPLLLKKEKEEFARFLDSKLSLKTHVPLGGNTFLYMPQETILMVESIRKVNKSPITERLSFIANPSKYLVNELAKKISDAGKVDEILTNSFVETPDFLSDRVKALGPWQKETCSFGNKASAEWFGDQEGRVGILLNGQYYWLTEDELKKLISDTLRAKKNGDDAVLFYGEEIPTDSIPVQELEKCIESIFNEDSPENELSDRDDEDNPDEESTHNQSEDLNNSEDPENIKYGPAIKRNLHSLEYKVELIKRTHWNHSLSSLNPELSLLPHQEECLSWLQDLWNKGCPGALLADDMGLGKTIECLSFLAWIAEERIQDDNNMPSLIIAPAGLLSNWEEEGSKWIGMRFGSGLRLDGNKIKELQKLTLSERFNYLENKVWTVTSYEMLRLHQDFFLQQKWGLVVLDEAQKIKTPNTLQTECVKALKCDFLLAMTGTPVENSFIDLWSIMDAAVPGMMGSAEEFAKKWSDNEHIEESGRNLRDLLEGKTEDLTIRLMMRRLKTERLKALPEKIEKIEQVEMPAEQAIAYQQALNERNMANTQNRGLALLSKLAIISLLPRAFNETETLSQQDIQSSAKLTALFRILDEIALNNEKVVIFISHLVLQNALTLAIHDRYKMNHVPAIINGKKNSDLRQKVVRNFQDPKNNGLFDCVVLTNRSAATGLTLTAANHVIHLERWWNPAVEEQCSARCWRIGQTKDVTVHIPVCSFPGGKIQTFDQVLNNFLQIKRLRSESLLMPQQDDKTTVQELYKALTSENEDS